MTGASDVTARRVSVGDLSLNVLTAGVGEPVVLLHGFPDSAQLWRPQISALVAAGHRVIAPDLRGFGDSDRPADVSAYRMPLLVGDVLAVMDAEGAGRADVVGHDWGAGLAWSLAMARPQRVRRLAVLSVGHRGAGVRAGITQRQLSWYMLWFQFPGVAEAVLPRADWAFFREWAWQGAAPGTVADCERQIADLSRPGALTAGLNWYRANIRPDMFVETEIPNGPRVQCPTMGVWSSGDAFLGEAQMTGSQAYVDGPWRYERVEGHHWIPAVAGDPVSPLLVDFFADTGV